MTVPATRFATNIGEACTRLQCASGLGDRAAMRFLAPAQSPQTITFGELHAQSNRAANALLSLPLGAGDTLFTFLPKQPALFYAFLGALKARIQIGTLFSNFGEDALVDRLADAGAKAVLTKKSLLRKVLAARPRIPSLRTVLVADLESNQSEDVLAWPPLLSSSSPEFPAQDTDPETPSVIHYTSGSTGKPKGVVHVHASLSFQRHTAESVLGLRSDDVFWCTADQGWVTGTSYGIIGPWSLGITQVHDSGPYSPSEWFRILQDEGVTVWYTAPTALRMLSREDPALFRRYDLSRLRSIFSVGEPLNPEIFSWGMRVLGKEIYDTWFQTETGAIMISNRPGIEVRPGSMGRPVPGIEAAILDEGANPVAAGQRGNLCVRTSWPSMFRGYKNAEATYAKKFLGGYYFSGDTAYCDRDGYFWFTGRSDDIINTAGHLVSPFEVESALLEVPEVAESGVVAAPDPILFEKVVAFVRLRDGIEQTAALELKIRLHVSNRVSSIATPQQVLFVDSIPKNRAGKIMRRVLKARFLGQDCGDLSTLESDP